MRCELDLRVRGRSRARRPCIRKRFEHCDRRAFLRAYLAPLIA
jgi:hypothetical protein